VKTKITVRGLTKRFGETTAVADVGFDVGENEFFSLVGPSGCGKTTTLRCVAGLETADEGEIVIGDTTVYASARNVNVPTNHRSIGMVFQNYAVWPHMTVFNNIAYPLRVKGTPKKAMQDRVDRVLAMLGMSQLAERKPSQLSGGQQQRVALGRGLVSNPEVLLLDEPLSNLDAKLRELMRIELKQVQKETGIPILYVTHDQVEALSMSDRIAVMSDGKIHQLASPTEIYERPATQFVLDFIGSVNYLPCKMIEISGDTICVQLDDGDKVRIVRPSYVPNSQDALLAIRPEDMTIKDEQEDDGVRGVVELRSFLGNICEYQIRAGSIELRVQTDKTVLLQEGDKVKLGVERGLLLDADARSRPSALARASS
jgi:iron(III) transport system ATP-binding protein